MKREIRAGAVAGPAGVGAVIDVGQESFVVPGIQLWRQPQLRIIELRRLSERLHKVLKAPVLERPTLQVRRFPRAMFCESCRRMVMWRVEMEREGQEPRCQQHGCQGALVPMRFVATCENGHLDDVDWWRWAHSGPHRRAECRDRTSLSFRIDTSVATGGLSSLRVQCACGSWRSLEDLANRSIVRGAFPPCGGRHPWLFGAAEACGADVVVLQRGSTNLHYASTISALDIPIADAEGAAARYADQVRQHARYGRLLELSRNTTGDTVELLDLLAERIATDTGCPKPTVLEIVQCEAEGRPLPTANGADAEARPLEQAELLDEEWQTMRAALQAGQAVGQHFLAVAEPLGEQAPQWLHKVADGVLLLRRLREVRAFLGFQRVTPGAGERTVRPDVGGNENWLPASEVFGEGFVLSFRYDMLDAWRRALPQAESEQLAGLERKRVDENFWFLPPVDPVFIALHTLSHLLLRQVTFDCGYAASALRERIYYNAEGRYAALMLFTADGDSEGSLGGLVRQGRSDRLVPAILEALAQGGWCSADPVCVETSGQGLGGFNHAACHACSLVSETSCVAANTLLDRRMLFDPSWGLLRFMQEAR